MACREQTGSRPGTREPHSHTQPVPQQPPSHREREGLLQPLPGGWTDGKELAACPRKANSLLRLLYEGLANAHTAENRATAQERERTQKSQVNTRVYQSQRQAANLLTIHVTCDRFNVAKSICNVQFLSRCDVFQDFKELS